MSSSSYTLFIRLLYSVRGDIRMIQQRKILKSDPSLQKAQALESALVNLSTPILNLQHTLDYLV